MSKRKVSVPERSARKPVDLIQNSKVLRFIGVSLAGGKSDKACVAILEYYPDNKKIFLSRLFEKIKSDENISGDLKIHDLINQNEESTKFVAFDTPWSLPFCMTCTLRCPGYENCKLPHIEWMWRHQDEKQKKKRPKKLFTPYTQRCIEMYFQTDLDEKFNLHHALGSNSAPLLARAHFIQRRVGVECIEAYPALTLWRLGKLLGVMRSHLKSHRAAFGGDEARAQFLSSLNENDIAFVYNQDLRQMVENNHAFEAFLCGFTAYLKYKGLTEKPPKDFPENEDWIEFPKADLKLKDL